MPSTSSLAIPQAKSSSFHHQLLPPDKGLAPKNSGKTGKYMVYKIINTSLILQALHYGLSRVAQKIKEKGKNQLQSSLSFVL